MCIFYMWSVFFEKLDTSDVSVTSLRILVEVNKLTVESTEYCSSLRDQKRKFVS